MIATAPEYGSAACTVVTSRSLCSSAVVAKRYPEVLPLITRRIAG